MTAAALAIAAESLVGTPFRLHGRDPAHGLDCVGLLEAALQLAGRPVLLPRHYTLRVRDPLALLPPPETMGFALADGAPREGDVLLLRAGPAQAHVAIVGRADALIHAHAGLRRVVRSPRDPAADRIAHWRLLKEFN
jgi:cell wall-associated NlpC family hydrolase